MIYEALSAKEKDYVEGLFLNVIGSAESSTVEDNASEAKRQFETSASPLSIVPLLITALVDDTHNEVTDDIVKLIRFFYQD